MAKRRRSKSQAGKKYKRSKIAYVSPITRFGGSKIVGLPAGMRVDMKYVERINMTSAIVPYTENVFRAFSIYDPNLSGTGHQPLGHDQWANMYRRYRVLGSKIKVHFDDTLSPAVNVATYPQQCALALCEGSGGFTSAEEVGEQPVSSIASLTFNGGPKVLSLPYNQNWMTKGDLGGKYDDDSSALFGYNPGRDGFYHIAMQEGTNTLIYARMLVEITYTVWVFDPVDQLQS